MKIKYRGMTTFQILTDNLTVVTDPLALSEYGLKLNKLEADIALFTQQGLENGGTLLKDTKVVPDKREKTMEITTPGEFEMAEVVIQRPLGKSYYMIDYGYTRCVYLGFGSNDIDPNEFNDVGDVEVLFLPVGNGELFPSYEKLEEIISNVDPRYLVPCGYGEKGMKGDLKSLEEFIKYFGYSASEESYLNITGKPESEERSMEVVILSSK
jgi:L-ascorbate metabolism protein UlaG (beta-lactamase superfamily)